MFWATFPTPLITFMSTGNEIRCEQSTAADQVAVGPLSKPRTVCAKQDMHPVQQQQSRTIPQLMLYDFLKAYTCC